MAGAWVGVLRGLMIVLTGWRLSLQGLGLERSAGHPAVAATSQPLSDGGGGPVPGPWLAPEKGMEDVVGAARPPRTWTNDAVAAITSQSGQIQQWTQQQRQQQQSSSFAGRVVELGGQAVAKVPVENRPPTDAGGH